MLPDWLVQLTEVVELIWIVILMIAVWVAHKRIDRLEKRDG